MISIVLAFMPFWVSAQTVDSTMCPIDGGFEAALTDLDADREYEDRFVALVRVQNASVFAVAGVTVGVGLYADDAPVPNFWTVLPNQYQILAGEAVEIPLDVSLASVPPGEYTARVVAKQGSLTEVFGSALADTGELPGYTIQKVGPASSAPEVSVLINGSDTLATAETNGMLDVSITTKNESDTPLIRSTLVASITQGDTPLGLAVRNEVEDQLLLVPQGSRVTTVQDRFLESGLYTVYAGLVTEGVFQAVQSTPVLVGDSDMNLAETLPYVSYIGISEYPLTSSSDVVVCVDQIDSSGLPFVLSTPLAFDLSVTRSDRELFSGRQSTDDTNIVDYVRFSPSVTGGDARIHLELSAERFTVPASQEESGDTTSSRLSNFMVVQEFEIPFSCAEPDGCQTPAASRGQVDGGTYWQRASESFWFYAGVTIAAALLLYIMLRRLHPEDDGSLTEPKKEELH